MIIWMYFGCVCKSLPCDIKVDIDPQIIKIYNKDGKMLHMCPLSDYEISIITKVKGKGGNKVGKAYHLDQDDILYRLEVVVSEMSEMIDFSTLVTEFNEMIEFIDLKNSKMPPIDCKKFHELSKKFKV